jgi:hypothetical protein
MIDFILGRPTLLFVVAAVAFSAFGWLEYKMASRGFAMGTWALGLFVCAKITLSFDLPVPLPFLLWATILIVGGSFLAWLWRRLEKSQNSQDP